jgi:acetyl-CoA carboxylase biotin carboxyl carrier protein
MKAQDIADLKQLIEFLKEYQVAEFDLDRGDLKIRLKFNQPPASSAGSSAGSSDLARLLTAAQAAGAPPAAAPAEPAAPANPEVSLAAETDVCLHTIKSPIVGTFYAAPSQEAEPFVSPGDHIAKGQVVGIVEAMKLMNEIESDATGEVVKCLVPSGQPIEYGQPLFLIRLG